MDNSEITVRSDLVDGLEGKEHDDDVEFKVKGKVKGFDEREEYDEEGKETGKKYLVYTVKMTAKDKTEGEEEAKARKEKIKKDLDKS